MRALQAFCLFALLAGLAAAARADVGPSVEMHVENLSAPIVPGTPLTFEVVIKAGAAMQLKNFTHSGDWVNVTTDFPADSIFLPSGQGKRFHVSATPSAEDMFTLRFLANDRAVVEHFDLTRRHFDVMHRRNGVTAVPGLADLPVIPEALTLETADAATRATRPLGANPVSEQDISNPPSLENHTVTVKGRFVYLRDDNQWIGADGVTVRVYDEDWGIDEHLGTTTTKPDGTFSINVSCSESQPDLYCELETSNGSITIEDGTWENNYVWTTHIETDFSGLTLDYGSFSIADASLRPALHMMTNLMRAWRFYKKTTGTSVPHVDCEWPSSDWPHYISPGGSIHIPEVVAGTVYGWKTTTHIHEYGHHIMDDFMWNGATDYDNGVCNNDNGDPGHCKWCAENETDAVVEGWPNWYADVVTRSYPTDYGLAANETRDQEKLTAVCQDGAGMPCNCDPNQTEGYFGALCRDLEDDTPFETDGNAPTGGLDALALGAKEVIGLMVDWKIDSPLELIHVLHVGYQPLLNSAGQAKLWSTATNAGYKLVDNLPPDLPGNFHSTDHSVNTPSPDATLSMEWLAAYDDYSGAAGYAINVSPNGDAPSLAPTTNGLTWTSGTLVPGTYYVTIRSMDRAGNWSPGFATAGPYVIRAPYPGDLGPGHPAGWAADIVPNVYWTNSYDNQPLPALLYGNSNSTFAISGYNHGESATEWLNRVRVLVDGVPVDSTVTSQTPAGDWAKTIDMGMHLIPGGRHTVEAWQDSWEFNAEPDENDNRYGIQYVWTPLPLVADSEVVRPAPPVKDGGWNSFSVPIGYQKFFNCDGLTYTHQINPRSPAVYGWCAVTAYAESLKDDVDLYLHEHTTGIDDGFTDGVAHSTRGGGQLDALFTSSHTYPVDRMDVGVVNYNQETSAYRARFVPSVAAAVGDSFVVTLPDHAMLALVDLHVTLATAGKIAVEVDGASQDQPVYTLWFAPGFLSGGMSDYDGKVATAADGHSLFTITSYVDSYHGLAFYRNPQNGTGPATFKVRIYKKTADPKPVSPLGWYASLTPRPAADATPGSVPAPPSLPGDSQSTWFNVALANGSDVPLSSVYAQISLDHTVYGGPWLFNIAPNDTGKAVNALSPTLPGGRHVLSMTLDPNHVLPELSDQNNTFAEQWVWIPAAQSLGSPVWRKGTSGGKTAGWELVDPSEDLDYDCDGIRTPAFSPTQRFGWAAVAVTPQAGSDVDLRLHAPTSSAKGGFGEPLETSNWGPGITDYVVIHFPKAPYQPFDAGIVRSTDDSASYVCQVVGSVVRPSSGGELGPFTLEPNQLMDLHEFNLPVGEYNVRLVNDGGSTVDWGLAVYGGDRPYQNRLAGLDLDSRWANGPGQDEVVNFRAGTPGSFCVVVWKNGAADVAKTGRYRLEFTLAELDAPPGAQVPARTRVVSAAPNPFRSGSDVSFELSRSGDATLEVFDIRGARVRTLSAGSLEAGPHHVHWDGSDERGRPVAEGVYMVRLVSPGGSDSHRVVKLR